MSDTKNAKPSPDEDVSRIKELLDKGMLNTITVDTSIFDEKGRTLTKGMFSQLTQFGRHPATLVISDVVLKEMNSHLVDQLKSAKAKFSPDLLVAWESLGLEKSHVQELLSILKERPSLEEIAKGQFSEFLDESDAEILLAKDHVPMDDLLEMYFQRKPPFEESNVKKSEFPDAIALQTLEAWASKTGRNLIVVSKDKDWKNFCSKSELLHLVSDLATALELLQTPDEVVKTMLRRVHDELQDPGRYLHAAMTEFVEDIEWYEHIRLDADSQFQYEQDEIEVEEVSNILFPTHLEDIKLTELTAENITVTFRTQADVRFVAHFNFRKWDSLDREYLSMGSGKMELTAAFEFDIILILPIANGAFNDITMDAEIDTVDMQVGEIEPDWMSSSNREDESPINIAAWQHTSSNHR
ncbi:PIN domain-containing protein [Massilia psychrophila]|uniref:DUF4935 domain-containing protein n=1 Tax=Massilia psychrophila TaxID=1603353 RepID=A0A2G8T0H1_9BURK|nr:PIN domain-containing protein [Massilia psychrophila]PIL39198.1 hypothetical protein CR103_14010 [Massilia psychrophila]GGE82113.1 hypothetical protein GCM10008020_28800 [Massilia psychrophila]